MVCGFSCTPEGLLSDRDLRHFDFIGMVRYDWMHTQLQNGVLTTEAALMLASCGTIGIGPADVQAHLTQPWSFPSERPVDLKKLWLIFRDSDRRVTEDNIRAGASQMLALYGLLRVFFEHRVGSREEVRPQMQSFQAACHSVDILLDCKRGRLGMATASRQLKAAVARHLQLHVAAYGKDYLKPKHHWNLDVAEQLGLGDPFMVDAFMLENLHRRAKTVTRRVDDTRRFERSALAGVLSAHRNSLLDDVCPDNGLLGKTEVHPDRPLARIGNRLQQEGLQVSVGDIVVKLGRAGEGVLAAGRVEACISEAGSLYVMVLEMAFVRRQGSHGIVFSGYSRRIVWPAEWVDVPVCWLDAVDGWLVVMA